MYLHHQSREMQFVVSSVNFCNSFLVMVLILYIYGHDIFSDIETGIH